MGEDLFRRFFGFHFFQNLFNHPLFIDDISMSIDTLVFFAHKLLPPPSFEGENNGFLFVSNQIIIQFLFGREIKLTLY